MALQREQVDGMCSKRLAGAIPSVKAAPVPGTCGADRVGVYALVHPMGTGAELHTPLPFTDLPLLRAL